MNILLIGGEGNLLDKLIIKYKKEGHRIYLLTGNKYKKAHTEKVFEKYYFDYESDNLSEIFESVDADITIFLGIHDSNFKWIDEKKEAIRFTSAVMNILVAYSGSRKGKFIYLSSDEVYEESSIRNIKEDELATASSFKGMALAQSENMCANYRNNLKLDLQILRLDHLYGIPQSRKTMSGVCDRMCIEALEKGYIVARTGRQISMLFDSDAVEFIFNISMYGKVEHVIYNISSGEEISEYRIANLVAENFEDVKVVMEDSQEKRICLSNDRFKKEFGLELHARYKDTIGKIAKHIKEHKDEFMNDMKSEKSVIYKLYERVNSVFISLLPFIENLICFIPFFMLNNRAVGSRYFENLDFYLLYVLLFAIIYGQQQAIFSATLSVAGYCFRQMYDRSSFSVMQDYNTYVWITQLFILGLVVGYMRDELRMIRMENEEEQEHLKHQLDDILDINNSNMRVKDVLERQVIDQRDSIGKIYSMTSTLDQYMPDEVLFCAVELISQIMDSEDVAIYSIHNEQFARLFSSSSAKARELGNSIKYKEMGEVYEEILQKKVYINRKLEEGYPLMANAIFEHDKMQMIIMVWGIPWERVTLGQANLLTVASYLIQNALLRADRYMSALESQRYVEGSLILDDEAFESLVNAYRNAKKKNLTECTLVCIADNGIGTDILSRRVTAILRQTDYLGMLGDKLCILLANTDTEDAAIVVGRLQEIGINSFVLEE